MWDITNAWGLFSLLGILSFALATTATIIFLARWLGRKESLLKLISAVSTGGLSVSRKRRKRAELLREPFPAEWQEYLDQNVHLFCRLSSIDKRKLRDELRIFSAEKEWEGCRGLALSDEIRVTIAAQACLLLLGIEHDYFREVTSILVYPSAFLIPAEQHQTDGAITGDITALGQAWYRGPVILAWNDVLAGGRGEQNGHNVVLHEFAHQIDYAGGGNVGSSKKQWRRWQHIMADEYHDLVRAARLGHPTLLDRYGAESPAEFFAVATECFFELPVEMKELHPKLYKVMRDFYGQNPIKRFER